MVKRTQKARKTLTGEWLYCNFSAHPEEIAKWKAMAAADSRSLSWWIRDILNKEVARWNRGFTGHENSDGKNQAVGVAPVSPDRA